MIPKIEKISIPAHDAIVDGDDIHLTDSCDEDEGNFSVIANASCRTRSTVVGHPEMAEMTKFQSAEDKSQLKEKDGIQSPKRSLKVVKLFRQLRQSRRCRLLLLKFRQQSLLRRSSTKTVAEYEEMLENEFGFDQEDRYALDSETIVSLRSSRNNVRTGQSMLVRQKAQVVNRPSRAHSNWDISPSHSIDAKNYRNFMLRGQSLILDDSSIGGMSDITEDASVFSGYSKMNNRSFRRTPMFINTDTYRINEDDEDESGSESETEIVDEERESGSPSHTSIEHTYDFREISPLNDDVEPTQLAKHDYLRRRVYSDSDIGSWNHRNVIHTKSQREDFCTPSGSSDNDENFHGKIFRERIPQSSRKTSSRVTNVSWPFPRTRIYSDSCIEQIPNDDEFRMIFQDHDLEHLAHRNSSSYRLEAQNESFVDTTRKLQSSRRQSLPLFENEMHNHGENLRSRTHSDSVVHGNSVQEDILWDPENTHAQKDLTITTEPFSFIKTADKGIINPHPASSSVLATHSNNQMVDEFEATENQKCARPIIERIPSPKTLNAACIIAAALRPAPAKRLPAIPLQSPSAAAQQSDQYYWGETDNECTSASIRKNHREEDREMELKNLCSWSSDSFDDIF